VKPYDILDVKNALVNPVYCVTDCTICSLHHFLIHRSVLVFKHRTISNLRYTDFKMISLTRSAVILARCEIRLQVVALFHPVLIKNNRSSVT